MIRAMPAQTRTHTPELVGILLPVFPTASQTSPAISIGRQMDKSSHLNDLNDLIKFGRFVDTRRYSVYNFKKCNLLQTKEFVPCEWGELFFMNTAAFSTGKEGLSCEGYRSSANFATAA